MKRLLILLLSFFHVTVLAQSSSDPWWERSDVGLPELIADGWVVSFYDRIDNSRSEYLLQHPSRDGLWHCTWIRNPNERSRRTGTVAGYDYTVYCRSIREGELEN